ncbi:MAG: hypothetical protein MUF79_13715 [Burkholderiales bacterium]|nr:hypothetical protein [Burkholderiales bacterium]
MDREPLRTEVIAAFRQAPRPALDEITPHACDECDELRDALHPHEPASVPDAVLDRHRWDLPLLSDESKQYYLPAWLLRSIDAPRSDYTEALLFALDSDHRWSPKTPYTARQWRVLGSYLAYIESDADEAMGDAIGRIRARLADRI